VWLRRISTWVGLAFVVMACPPFPWGVDVLFGLVFLVWFSSTNRRQSKRRSGGFGTAITAVFVLLLLCLSTIEFVHRQVPTITGQKSDHLVVIGDSISAGLGVTPHPWPDVMREMTGIEVINLSKPGATMKDGIAMAAHVAPEDHLVLIELGGNDLISGGPSSDFERALGTVTAKLAAPGRTLVMFELPLMPQMVSYGQVQRRLAKKYGIWLIPKRCLARVLSTKDATSDGLHLTDIGARRMATLVVEVLAPVLKVQSGATSPATRP